MIKRNHAVMTHAFFTDTQSVRSFQLFASLKQGNTKIKQGNCVLYLNVHQKQFQLIHITFPLFSCQTKSVAALGTTFSLLLLLSIISKFLSFYIRLMEDGFFCEMKPIKKKLMLLLLGLLTLSQGKILINLSPRGPADILIIQVYSA